MNRKIGTGWLNMIHIKVLNYRYKTSLYFFKSNLSDL